MCIVLCSFFIRQNYECAVHPWALICSCQSLYQKASCSGENCWLSLQRPSCKRAVWVDVVEGIQGNTSLGQSLLDSNTNTLPCWAFSVWASWLFSCILLIFTVPLFFSISLSPMSLRYKWHVSKSIFMYFLSHMWTACWEHRDISWWPEGPIVLQSSWPCVS